MLWLSIYQNSEVLSPLTGDSRPWAKVGLFWRFCRLYGDYQATPPHLRRQFVINMEQARKERAC